MISNLNATSSRLSRRARVFLGALALSALASPLVYVSTAPAVQAEDPAPAPGSAAGAKEPAIEFLPQLTKAEERILAALAEPTTIDFQETPLEDAVNFLKDKHSIEIQIDTKALEDAGSGVDAPVTRKLNGIPLRSALRLMLTPLQLKFDIRDDVLQITTGEQAEAWLMTRTYPVGDLIEENDYDSIIEAITSTVVPQTWDEVGGAGSIVSVTSSKSLVISQTRDVHDGVLQLLRSLRSARKTAAAGQ